MVFMQQLKRSHDVRAATAFAHMAWREWQGGGTPFQLLSAASLDWKGATFLENRLYHWEMAMRRDCLSSFDHCVAEGLTLCCRKIDLVLRKD